MVFLIGTQVFQDALQFLPVRALAQDAREVRRRFSLRTESKGGLFRLRQRVGKVCKKREREVRLRWPAVG
jgi:hypothetical protein